MNFYFSANDGLLIDGINAIPADAVNITASQRQALLAGQESGKIIITDADGFPVLADRPGPSAADFVAAATAHKTALRLQADAVIAPLQDAVDFGMATETEQIRLTEWKKYRVLLNRIDTSTAPDIIWPDEPA
ncbi:tail fiber assembly protein [Lonsdalea quercina]|uniref:tail fiber assembly protein n=1 Tax=Lonsdalea quercina TaxID=71657 RepID=UPI003975F2C8